MHCGRCNIDEKITRVMTFKQKVRQLKEKIEKRTGLKVMTGSELSEVCVLPYFDYERWVQWEEMKRKVLIDIYVSKYDDDSNVEGSSIIVDINDSEYTLTVEMGIMRCNDKLTPVVILKWWVEGMLFRDIDDLMLIIFLTPTQ
jgi:hypothetical protein